ncbi:hypothetical protein GUITHDRAFT_85149 [Guillardia theta CCMP2712]|uniref:Aminopeptidase N n=1 Tax=Guillardia theta (strain CCMP2712) TaxID=905079 RepID=L1JSU8_GUITC|nr:hypothetical protein GUITHDRAFT_85149 [Guillardia theta CCMP2712]EKX51260.1 hypothetical protein GUITHDRAFT_85149 [Guillardia theta CCMP2712]|eukprot:XP_005838240.1 hypothetical protein GUITHDRAFT_85149 [Guillardia theta CCMP2712]
MAEKKALKEKFRRDYTPTNYFVEQVNLLFQVFEDCTKVSSSLKVKRRDGAPENAPFQLDGEGLTLQSLSIDGETLPPSRYSWVEEDLLEISGPLPSSFVLQSLVTTKPEENTQLSGLYKSSSIYCTQCEAEGFRRITLMQDRPDIMATYEVRIEADKESCPVLLSNGNMTENGDLENGRHFATYNDPFPKPSYLFAMVAGDLGFIRDTFVTRSEKVVALNMYSEHNNVKKLYHAMDSLKKAMRWDEETFGLEYDLDIFNVVAVNDFNMGAMENKSLNIFNTSCVLASPETATDADYERIQGIIAHEYFHNWTGNRVTCRDWFQLTLKEGLTVFRDQQFSMDMTSAAVKRIEDVNVVRSMQFPEDNGPMAHPIRPESYIAMDNFYTVTVYRKGAEVIRMYHTLLGKEGFRKGMDLYFQRHDGSAVTCDDFRRAMADANGVDLTQFERWYLQAGTPVVRCEAKYDVEAKRLSLLLKQSCRTPQGGDALPFHMPIRVGFLAQDGSELLPERVLELKEASQEFVIENVNSKPVLSLLRGFSAPIKLEYERDDEELAFLMAHDKDSFNRWEAGQLMFSRTIHANAKAMQAGQAMQLNAKLVDAVRRTLLDTSLDKSLQAYALTLPNLQNLAESMEIVDPDALVDAYKFTKKEIARSLRDHLLKTYEANLLPEDSFRNDAEAIGMRRLKNVCLGYLAALGDKEVLDVCLKQALTANCMTDLVAAASCLAANPGEQSDKALEHFYQQHAKDDNLVFCKWIAIQAAACTDQALEIVDKLFKHPSFTIKNPNICRSLFISFAGNMKHFHRADGSGHRWLTDRILELDKLNPQTAAKILTKLAGYKRFDAPRQASMKAQLERVRNTEGVSKDTMEIAIRALA